MKDLEVKENYIILEISRNQVIKAYRIQGLGFIIKNQAENSEEFVSEEFFLKNYLQRIGG